MAGLHRMPRRAITIITQSDRSAKSDDILHTYRRQIKENAVHKNRRHQEEKMTYGRKRKPFQPLNDTLMCLSDHERKFMLITFLLVAFRR
jgi:hypothetical protein